MTKLPTATTPDDPGSSPQERIEKTFELLQTAKQLESESNYWLATEKFLQAHKLLEVLAEEASDKAQSAASGLASTPATTTTTTTKEEIDETKRIAALYGTKAEEYWKQSRQCLIRAMEQEKLHDEQQRRHPTNPAASGVGGSNDNEDGGGNGNGNNNSNSSSNSNSGTIPIKTPRRCTLLDDHQARARNRSFSALFSRPVVIVGEPSPTQTQTQTQKQPQAVPVPATATEDNESSQTDALPVISNTAASTSETPIIEDHDDLEARLRALNRSLPSGFKTTDERMSEVNRGLNKLGLSLYTQKRPFSRFEDEVPKSEDEQIDDIIAQANDEALVDRIATENDPVGGTGTVPLYSGKQDGDDDFSSDDDDNDNDDEDSSDGEQDELLDDDQLAMKMIQKEVVKAQTKLAELVAILEQARTKRARDEIDEEEAVFKNDYDGNSDNEDGDDDSNRDIQQNDVAFLMMTGKRKLKSAQRGMRRALAEWEDLTLS